MSKKKSVPAPCIYVVAGPNGGGKSSIMGEMLLASGGDYFNPDHVAKRIQEQSPGLSVEDANSQAWKLGKVLLEKAIREHSTWAFETTLGGRTIPQLLEKAVAEGLELRIWFIALASAELHIGRVHKRVKRGGHNIPEAKVRERFERSRVNLVRLLPRITELRLYDNSFDADVDRNIAPNVELILHLRDGKIISNCTPEQTPEWAKPIVEMALKITEQ